MTKFLVYTTLELKRLWPSSYVTKKVEADRYKVGDNGTLRFYGADYMSVPIATFASEVWAWVEMVADKDIKGMDIGDYTGFE